MTELTAIAATEPLRMVMCGRCSAPTGTLVAMSQFHTGTCEGCQATEGIGPWEARDGDGNYVPDEDAETDERPRCNGCGESEFVARAEVTASWYGGDVDMDTSSAYFTLSDNLGNGEITIECSYCGRDVTREISWDSD